MFWAVLIVGIALWWGAHLFKRVAPTQRAALGDPGKGMIAILLVLAIVLMWFGYRNLSFVSVWQPPAFLVHMNNLLMLVAIFMMSPAGKRGKLLQGLRHPMLTGFGVWAFAHLLVNGDLASIVMFGGLLLWSVTEVRVINGAEPEWTPGSDGTYAKDAMFVAGSVILLAVIGYIHAWVGVWPFPS